MSGHDWITVLARRWCIGCDAFQMKRGDAWTPSVRADCPRTTPAAQKIDAALAKASAS